MTPRYPIIYLPVVADQKKLFYALWAENYKYLTIPTVEGAWVIWENNAALYPWVYASPNGMSAKMYTDKAIAINTLYIKLNSIQHFIEYFNKNIKRK